VTGDRLAAGDALLAARLCAIDPGLGGIVLRGGDGEWRDAVIAELIANLPDEAPVRRMPLHIDDERLLGGLDLTATLALGRTVAQAGLLAQANGGVIVVPLAERMSDAVAGRIAAVIDIGAVVSERDGIAARHDARFIVIALDDGLEPDEAPPVTLCERLAFRIDAGAASALPLADASDQTAPIADADAFKAIAATAAALGVDSARAWISAIKAARAAAQLAGRDCLIRADLELAVALVLAPRATRIPAPVPQPPDAEAAPPPENENASDDTEQTDPGALDDVILEAALAALPRDVLAQLAQAGGARAKATRAHGAGERRKSATRGRPLAARAGMPGGGRRLSLIDTLRAAAPWQRLRGRGERIEIRRDDLRIRRFATRAEVLTIFAVDASGSSALARLAEAKGAVELLLAEAYVKRAHVALVAFRGTGAEVLLGPTRSLARARRSLAELPGGGGTPLAAGLDAARELAEVARARGRTPFVVVLTDGRANIAADGRAVRALAEQDAERAAKAIAAAGIACAFVDTSPRPRAEGAALAAAMRARYLPLPRADAAAMHAAISAVQGA
jgi:magnesium chelatase subunit D